MNSTIDRAWIDQQFEKDPTIRLRSNIDVPVRPASYRSTRGSTCIAIVADEISFWRIEGSANPDTEVLRVLRPSLATSHGPLIAISSPYARRGEAVESL
jgi:hypothetical protein